VLLRQLRELGNVDASASSDPIVYCNCLADLHTIEQQQVPCVRYYGHTVQLHRDVPVCSGLSLPVADGLSGHDGVRSLQRGVRRVAELPTPPGAESGHSYYNESHDGNAAAQIAQPLTPDSYCRLAVPRGAQNRDHALAGRDFLQA
jgi:hypothetical protein